MSGTLRPGDRIPFEHQLMEEYDCSRMTVNKALSSLAAANLIVRRRGAGSFVAQPRMHVATLIVPDVAEEIRSRGKAYHLDLLDRTILAASDPRIRDAAMQVPDEAGILSLTCRHLADATPFAIEERLINLAEVPDAATVDFGNTPPGSWLLAHVPWTEAEHRILSLPAGQHAPLLGIAEAEACLVLERRTRRSRHSITWVRQTFPGRHFSLSARFSG